MNENIIDNQRSFAPFWIYVLLVVFEVVVIKTLIINILIAVTLFALSYTNNANWAWVFLIVILTCLAIITYFNIDVKNIKFC